MYVDSQLLFSDAQAVTAAAASTNNVDLTSARDIGTGENLYVVTVVDVALTDVGSDSALTVSLEGDSTTTFTPDGTQDLFTIPAVSAAGSVFYSRLDPGAAPLQFRYIQLKYTPTNGNLTTGSVTSFITHDIQRFVPYPKGYTIS